jgi:LysM repeat protein
VENRREFLKKTMWSALALWAAPLDSWAADPDLHIVAKGDTLSAIAKRYGTTIAALKASNGLKSDTIKVGQKLKLPAGAASGIHVVSKGETLSVIASQYGTSVRALKRSNGLKSDLIRVGQELKVPQGGFGGGSTLLAPVIAATDRVKVDSTRWRYIVCHHSAIEAGNAEVYGRAHLRRGMEHGLAYHFVIGNGKDSGDGEIEIGPRWQKQLRGGHVRNSRVNDTGIGICVVGNLQNHAPSRRQRQALNELIEFLREGHTRRGVSVTVHKQVDKNHTVCPGRHFPYGDLKRFA